MTFFFNKSTIAIILLTFGNSNQVFSQLSLAKVQTMLIPDTTQPRSNNFIGKNFNEIIKFPSLKDGQLSIANCNFDSMVLFTQSVFNKAVNIGNSHFRQLSDFTRTQFKGQANIGFTKFDDAVGFVKTRFYAGTNFYLDSFFNGAIFSSAVNNDTTSFVECYFKGRCSFDNTWFQKDISFNSCSFPDGADFTGAIFMGNLDFRNIRNIGSRIDLTNSTIGIPMGGDTNFKCGIRLVGSDISKFKIKFDKFYLLFDSNTSYEDRSNVYQRILTNLKDDGSTNEYETIDKEYRTYKYIHNGSLFYLWIDKNWWDFGYKKFYVFSWIFRFLVLFTLVNIFFYPFLNMEVYTINGIPTPFPWRQWRKLPFRVYYSLVYTSVIFFSLSVKLENMQYRRWYGVLYIFFIYLLGIICLAYTANFVLQK